MKHQRHPHPHVDPRQPRDGSSPGTNPPVFVWKPEEGHERFRLTVARDGQFRDAVIDLPDLREPMHLPEKALPPGRYFWKWSAGSDESEVFGFEIADGAVRLEVPGADEWLRRFGGEHPRIFLGPRDLPALRQSRLGDRAGMWRDLKAAADGVLAQPHEIAEPPFLGDWQSDYAGTFAVWHRVLVESRRFVGGALTMALAYLAAGDRAHARAACERMASISRWDPTGSSHIGHNDEAHMSVIWDGPQVCDWVWDAFTDAERQRVIDQFRRRGQITFEHMHDRGMYGVTRFDSHAGREIVFLAQIAFVFHEHVPDAARWLAWLRPVLCGVWPIWAGDDGGWSEGPSYGAAYVDIMTLFATALKRGAGVDLYRRPFWRNHNQWRRWCVPAYVQWLGFSDCGYPPGRFMRTNADLVETIDRQAGAGEMGEYVAACRAAAPAADPPAAPPAQLYLTTAPPAAPPAPSGQVSRVFPYVGLAAIRTDLDCPARDVAFLFRCSPLGCFSHSHASNTDFALHVAGEVLAMPGGYYDGYGSAHHAGWVWHTKSHNCATLSDSGQLMRSRDAIGSIDHPFEDGSLAYFVGVADASYPLAERFRRHVVFLKRHSCFVLIDDWTAAPGVYAALQWNVHSFERFATNDDRRTFRVERGGSALTGHFLHHHGAYFSLTEGWDPSPMERPDSPARPTQYNLRFNLAGTSDRAALAVVLCPAHAGLTPPEVTTERTGEVEGARIGADLLLVNQGHGIEHDGRTCDALAVLVADGAR
ncbi:MAG TPA: DUF4962 domain-containing protein, partial [Phycisphaerae bacterium]|nr:DUF4962 domain-containing protein [Phycisphaerae bacterium]